jgi:hypothetical protein
MTERPDAEQRSPLGDVLRRHGATMTTRHGRRVAAHFGSMATETAVCTGTLGIADRFDRTTLKLWGEPMDVRLALAALDRLPQRSWSSPLSARGAIVRCERADMERVPRRAASCSKTQSPSTSPTSTQRSRCRSSRPSVAGGIGIRRAKRAADRAERGRWCIRGARRARARARSVGPAARCRRSVRGRVRRD